MNNDKETTDTGLRYAAYANRVRTILLAAHRYVAYTSDIGESFRPVAHPYLVKSCYAISWSYILGDVAYEGWKANLKQNGQYSSHLKPWSKPSDYPEPDLTSAKIYTEKPDFLDWKVLMVKRGLFQSIASMGLPAFTIHSSVRYSSYLFKNSKIHALRTYGPVGVGLAVVPLLPYLFDEPVEHAIDYAFSEGKLLLA